MVDFGRIYMSFWRYFAYVSEMVPRSLLVELSQYGQHPWEIFKLCSCRIETEDTPSHLTYFWAVVGVDKLWLQDLSPTFSTNNKHNSEVKSPAS